MGAIVLVVAVLLILGGMLAEFEVATWQDGTLRLMPAWRGGLHGEPTPEALAAHELALRGAVAGAHHVVR